MEIRGIFRGSVKVIMVALMALLTTSCSLTKVAKIATQVKVGEITHVEIKGMTGVEVGIYISNNSPINITMRNASIDLKLKGVKLAHLVQVGEAVSKRRSTDIVKTVWQLEQVSPLNLLLLAAKISESDLRQMTIDYSAEMAADKTTRTLTGKDVDISKYVDNLSF